MPKRFLLVADYEDQPYLSYLKILLQGHQISATLRCPSTVAEVAYAATKGKVDHIITTNEQFLQKLVNTSDTPKISEYAGSIIDINFPSIPTVECLVLNPLAQLYSVRYGQFLAKRFLSKLTAPEKWNDPLLNFKWELATPSGLESFTSDLDKALFLSIDIETIKSNISISCVGYTAVYRDLSHRTIVIPFDSLFHWQYIKNINAHPIPKLFQNGLYDNCYFLRFGLPCRNWFYDTFHLFHSWYSELPRKLGFITSFTLRKWPFWKDLAQAGDLEKYYEYNARDCFGTASSWIRLVKEVPAWAIRNYTEHEFPMVFPSLYCQMEGWKINKEEFKRLREKELARLESMDKSLELMSNTPGFNANSPVQVKQLFTVCRVPGVKSTKESELLKYKHANVLAGRMIEKIIERREAKKAIGTYYEQDKIYQDSKSFRFLYGINPGGTDTGRSGSGNHPFWLGANIQNIPPYAKSMYEADEGYLLGEPDAAQSEARCVAYDSQDENLMATVESGRDYHGINVERFFGIAYEKIISPDGKVLDKPIRDLSKRVNHGANYNMTWPVLIDTMGLENIFKAKALLRLPKNYGPKEIAQHLLHSYEKAYPRVKTVFYDEIKYAIQSTKMLVSALGWTRYCFGNPSKNKPDLNAYVAHVPQNLSVQIINKGFYKALDFQKKNWPNFRLKAQIHDSTPFQYKEGREDLAADYAKLLECPVKVKGRIMLIPIGIKLGARKWSEIA